VVHRYAGSCRYADDLAVPVPSEAAGREALKVMSDRLSSELELTLNWDKSKVMRVRDLVYLGFSFEVAAAEEAARESREAKGGLGRAMRWFGRGVRRLWD
jgi:hypothetical protein